MRSRTVASEVSCVEDESWRTSDTPSNGGVPSSRSVTSNTMVQSIEIRGTRRTVTSVGDVVEDES